MDPIAYVILGNLLHAWEIKALTRVFQIALSYWLEVDQGRIKVCYKQAACNLLQPISVIIILSPEISGKYENLVRQKASENQIHRVITYQVAVGSKIKERVE